VEFIETSRNADGTRGGLPGQISMGGHLVLPRGINIPSGARRAMERDAVCYIPTLRFGFVQIALLQRNDIPLMDQATQSKMLVYNDCIVYKFLRSMTAPEALLICYETHFAEVSHAVVRIGVHEEGHEKVYWHQQREYEKAEALKKGQKTPFTAWLALNNSAAGNDEIAKSLTYNKIPLYFRWCKKTKTWIRRIKNIKVRSSLSS